MDRVKVARPFLRVSFDKSGRERSNEEQRDDNRRAWPGWEWLEPYQEVGSASKYATKERDDFPRLLGDLGSGRFGADVLVLWESSRGSRRVGEWVELIELCEDRGVVIAVTDHHRIYDPSNPRDRRSLLEDAVDSEYESAKISHRSKRAAAANAAAGRPNGAVPFGYRRRYDPETRRLVAQEPDPAEAPIGVELFDRVMAGHSLRSIQRDFEARRVRTKAGKVFSAQVLRNVLRRRCYVGERTHHGEVVAQGLWPAIVDRKTFLAVQRILDEPSRKTTKPGKAVHLLSMIACCDPCGGPLSVTRRDNRGRQYQCHNRGCVRVNADQLEELATDAMLAYLGRPENIERLAVDDGNDEALAAVRVEVAEVRAEHEELMDEVGAGRLSPMLAARTEPQILERLRAAEAREQELATPSVLRGLIEPGEDVAAQWEAALVATRRAVARMLLAPERLGELRVARSPTRGPVAVPAVDRVTWRTA